jgi:hypothetical protein
MIGWGDFREIGDNSAGAICGRRDAVTLEIK